MFHRRSDAKDRHASICKDCVRKYQQQEKIKVSKSRSAKKWRKSKRGKEYLKKYRVKGETIYAVLQRRLKRDGNLDLLRINQSNFLRWYDKQEKACYYCSMPLGLVGDISKSFGIPFRRLQIERKNPLRGYEKGNIVLACPLCNVVKQDIITYRGMREIGKKYIKPKWQKLARSMKKGRGYEQK